MDERDTVARLRAAAGELGLPLTIDALDDAVAGSASEVVALLNAVPALLDVVETMRAYIRNEDDSERRPLSGARMRAAVRKLDEVSR